MTQGQQKVTREMLILLAMNSSEPEFVLNREDVPYQTDEQGNLFVDPDKLGLPYTYGLGTDHLVEEEMEWPEWLEA